MMAGSPCSTRGYIYGDAVFSSFQVLMHYGSGSHFEVARVTDDR